MKVILYMAITVNGQIANADDDTSWTSKEDWGGFLEICKKIGNALIGKRTYEVVKKEGTQLGNILTVVLTHDTKLLAQKSSHTIFTDKQPRAVLALLEGKGYKEALVAGGGILNSAFMKEGLIDELYLDVEPLVLGSGIPLFAPEEFEKRLKLLKFKKLNQNTIQLHYQVIK